MQQKVKGLSAVKDDLSCRHVQYRTVRTRIDRNSTVSVRGVLAASVVSITATDETLNTQNRASYTESDSCIPIPIRVSYQCHVCTAYSLSTIYCTVVVCILMFLVSSDDTTLSMKQEVEEENKLIYLVII